MIQGQELVKSVIYLIVVGVAFWLLWWLVDYCKLPEPFNKVARVVLAVAAVLVIISLLLSMVGHPLIKW